MECSLALLSVLILIFLLSWRVAYSIWWKPMKLRIYLEKQGIRGPPYKLFYGNLQENSRMIQEARSRPMEISHKIITRVYPFAYNTVKTYGKVSLTWFGTVPRVFIMDPDLIKEVFSNKFGQFEKLPPNPLTRLVATGILIHEGEKWATHRRIINPAFHVEKLKRMLPSFTTSCMEMIMRWKASVSPQGSCELDMCSEFQSLTGDIISRTAFGSNYKEGKRIFEILEEQTRLFMLAVRSVYIPGFRFLPTKNNLRRKELDRDVRAILRAIIDRKVNAMKNGEARNDELLGLLLESISNDSQQQSKNSKNIGMTIEDVIEECKLFYLAGHETTSNLLTWTMVALCMNPSWQVRARDEVLQVCGNNTPDFDSLNHLKIVTMILYEVLRLYPAGVDIGRQTCKWTKLGHLSLPPGVHVMLPILLIQHDPEIWGEDAEEFKPERFSEGISKASKHQSAYFPFGGGPRICIGQSFALMEAKLALAMILQHFSFELSPTYVHAPCTVMTLKPQYGAQIILHNL